MKEIWTIFITLALLMVITYFISSRINVEEFQKFTKDCEEHGGEIFEFPKKHFICWNNETKTEIEW